jgi:sugar phosphate isomerase/epimerase
MKLAFSTNAFRKFSLQDAITEIAKIGYKGVEIMCDKPHLWPEDTDTLLIQTIKSVLSQNKIMVSNLNAFMTTAIGDFYHPSFIEKDLRYRRKRIEYTYNCIKIAKLIGAGSISVIPGGPVEKIDRTEALNIFKQEILEIAKFANKENVKILIEPEPDLLIQTSKEFIEFAKNISEESIGLNFDIGHFFCVGEDPAELIRFFGNQIHHIHIEDIAQDRKHFHLIPGKGVIDFARIFDALREIDYQDFVCVELYPYVDRPVEVAKKAYDFLIKFF